MQDSEWCYTCERMHTCMEWGEGCQDWDDVLAAETAMNITKLERSVKRYDRAANAIQCAAGCLYLGMVGVVLFGNGEWVGIAALLLVCAAMCVYVCAWPLQHRALTAQMQLLEAQYCARTQQREK